MSLRPEDVRICPEVNVVVDGVQVDHYHTILWNDQLIINIPSMMLLLKIANFRNGVSLKLSFSDGYMRYGEWSNGADSLYFQ